VQSHGRYSVKISSLGHEGLYALLPLTLSLSINLPPAIPFSRISHQSQISKQLLDYILIGNLCRKEKEKNWKTRPACLDHGSVTVFPGVFYYLVSTATWYILRIMNDVCTSSAGSARFPLFFFFFSFSLTHLFPSLLLGAWPFQQNV